jgi:hypothetical protein
LPFLPLPLPLPLLASMISSRETAMARSVVNRGLDGDLAGVLVR